MARLGMLIDLRTCIGCHACSVACKAEFDVPLGVFRDTVKSLILDSRVVDLRMVYTDNAPFHDPLPGVQRAGQYQASRR